MKNVQPEVFLVARPQIDYARSRPTFRRSAGKAGWSGSTVATWHDAQNLAEFAGKICYRAWEPGLNPNVRRVRTDHQAYLENILAQAHGSVLEHASFSFVLHNVSRVTTHELVRHRPGTAVSQESLRFVRLADIPFWFPGWAQGDAELMKRATALLDQMEEFQRWMAGHFGLDEEGVAFHEKKHKTSFMRRFAPDGRRNRPALDGQHPDAAAHHRGADRPRRRRGDPAGVRHDRRADAGRGTGPVRRLHGGGRRLGSALAQGVTVVRAMPPIGAS